MSDDTITIHQIGGDDLIASLREAVNEFIRQWVELVKKTTDANS